MRKEALNELAAADMALSKAVAMMTIPFHDEAGRHAYYAMFPAASAFVVERDFTPPKTHRGLHQLFARATRTETSLQPLVAQLTDAYRFKRIADYDPVGSTVAAAVAQAAIDDATQFVATIRAVLPQTPAP